MKSGVILLAVTALLVNVGCSAAIWGNLAVLFISIAIFFGTLSLGMPNAREMLSGASRGEKGQMAGAGVVTDDDADATADRT